MTQGNNILARIRAKGILGSPKTVLPMKNGKFDFETWVEQAIIEVNQPVTTPVAAPNLSQRHRRKVGLPRATTRPALQTAGGSRLLDRIRAYGGGSAQATVLELAGCSGG
jgi:hypothetical protein